MVHAEHVADHHGHHIVPLKTLLTIFATLVGLTILTVLTAQLDLGILNVPLALTIAIGKASLVVMFFMALKYDRPVNTLVFVTGLIFVLVFLVFTWFDIGFRGDVGNVDTMTISDRARQEELLRAREPGQPATVSPGEIGTDTLEAEPAVEGEVAPDTVQAAPAEPADTAAAPGTQ